VLQCVKRSTLCDGQRDCVDGTDEDSCFFSTVTKIRRSPPPGLVRFTPLSSTGKDQSPFDITPLPAAGDASNSSSCPETHFQCPGDGYCLPVFVRCNAVYDCPGREDEAACGSYSCPGFYRCYASSVCVHPSNVCDGLYDCPQQDDELFCDLACPDGCTCHARAFSCRRAFQAERFPEVRYLDARGSGLTIAQLEHNAMLIHLSLAGCGLERLHNTTLPNLRSLDISRNKLRVISADDLSGVLKLRHLSLSRNPLKSLFSLDAELMSLPSLTSLDLSAVKMPRLDTNSFSLFPNLHILNLSLCGVELMYGEGFQAASALEVLDLAGCPMTQFPRNLFSGLDRLQSVRADNFKLCCPANLPAGFNPANCKAPFDEVSSCEALLRSDVYRFFLSTFSALALLGNLGCFLLRSVCFKSGKSGFGVFVTHLSFSDFLMGVYLAIIGVADRLFQGTYLWEDIRWRESTACKVAGFLSLLSNEVSAFIICLITLDRFLVLRFPFKSLHFKNKSAHVTCGLVWVVVVLLATVPLLPMTSHWSFYGQTGICIPLPITRNDYAGDDYAYGVMIIFNFILFLLIAAGQASIYASIRANRMSTSDSTKKSNDLRIARRLITVALSDFLCWFPIGLLGLLASQGIPIPGEVNVGMAIFVLPLNSALNPFLYTLNIILERRRRSHDEKLLKELMAEMGENEAKTM